jgi:tetratricopeptide (TPR) repeat protein
MIGNTVSANEYLDSVAAQVPLFAAALQSHREGSMTKARAIYLELMERPELVAVCLHQLGVLAGQQGDHQKAADFLRRAVRLDDSQPIFHQNLASALEQMGKKAEALDVMVNLGVTLQTAERHAEAVNVYRHVVGIDPCRYAAFVNMGTGLALLRNPQEAVVALVRGVALHAMVLLEARNYLETVLPELIEAGTVPPDAGLTQGMPTGPVEKLEHALTTLGKTLSDLAHAEAAVTTYRAALNLSPGLALAHWNISLSLLSLDDFDAGWREYQWRWFWDRFPEPWRRLSTPQWKGESLEGKRICVYGEQGFGDIMQFCPLILDIAEQAEEVTLEVPSPLLRLMQQSFEPRGIKVFQRTDDPHVMQSPIPLDYQIPLMSLPYFTGLTQAKLPLATNYLLPSDEDKATWAGRLSELKGLKVGFVWAGRPAYSDDAKRSIPLEAFRALFEVEGISWVSLQFGHRTEEPQQQGIPMYNASQFLTDFADTAALISQLDLVIAVDTGTAHLSSILGIPTWIFLPKVPDWRWLLNTKTTRWYPNTRLFRQEQIGEWAKPIADVRDQLANWPESQTSWVDSDKIDAVPAGEENHGNGPEADFAKKGFPTGRRKNVVETA